MLIATVVKISENALIIVITVLVLILLVSVFNKIMKKRKFRNSKNRTIADIIINLIKSKPSPSFI